MAEVEVPPEAPAWMLALEKKRQRVHRLAHEVGAGSPCLLCQDDCPGLDLHFWRKICRNCKCKKEDHNVIDDCGAEQFEILLGSGHLSNRPNKAFLEMLEKHTSAKLKNQLKSFAFDWLPPDVSPVIAAEYMQSLPASKLPVSGSDGALYRRQQLERQLPLHDLDASQCHQLTDSEVDNLNKYLENLKNNVVGQGRVTKLHIPISNSLDSLSKIHTFNSVPKPFQSSAGDSLLSDARPQFDIGGHINSGNAVHLKPPSAFWPKSLSPEPNRSLSPGSDSQLPSVADRGAAFGVTLSPAKGTRPLPKSMGAVVEPTEGSPNAKHGRLSPGRLVKEQTLKSVAVSKNVPGNMWVPSECPECTRRGADGELIVERVCTHIADSKNVPPLAQPSECTKCVPKTVDGKLVAGQVCPHISYSSDVPLLKQPSECTKCVKKIVDGRLVYDKVCPHVGQSSDVRHPIVPTECTQCSQKIVDGKLVVGQVCSHISSSTDVPLLKQPSECTKCVKKIVDGKLVCDEVCPNVSQSSDVAHSIKPAECTQCIQKIVDGKLVIGQVCPHISFSSDVPHQIQPSECTHCMQKIVDGKLVFGQVCPHVSYSSDVPHRMQPSECTKCIKMGPDGKYIMDQHCPHILNAGDTFPSGLHPGHLRDLDVSESFPEGIPKRGSSPIPPGLLVPGSTTEKQEWNSLPGLRVPSPLIDEKGTVSRNRSPTSMMSSPGAPHTIALYAHNASSLDPQDTLSPHVAIMSLDDGKQSGSVTEPLIPQATDLTPVPDLNLHCAQCTQNISPGEVVVFADRAGPEVVWHPKCFVCNICQELLVDLVYFYNKGHVYCGRHYAEILDIPRCSACDELIFVKEYTVAEGQAFHVKHFCCFECDDPLGGKQYVPKDGQPICLPCYGKKYGKQCETCHTVIGAKDQGVTWKDLHWHATPDCFCCSFCQKSLLGGRFAVKDQKPFCCKECMQAGASSNHQKVSAV